MTKTKEPNTKVNARFYYIRDERRNPIATIASILYTDNMGVTHKSFGASVCHPNDKFDKKVGRSIALHRAMSAKDKEVLLGTVIKSPEFMQQTVCIKSVNGKLTLVVADKY